MADLFENTVFGSNDADLKETLPRYIKYSDWIFSFLAIGTVATLSLPSIPRPDNLESIFTADYIALARAFVDRNFLQISLIIFTWIWIHRYKLAVKNELNILISLFSDETSWPEWKKTLGIKYVPLISIGLSLLFIGLIYSTKKIQLYCIIVLIINFMDMRGNALIKLNITKFFKDPIYEPEENMKEIIYRRRAVAEEYWSDKPQLERICLMIFFMSLAILSSMSEQIFEIKLPTAIPYLIIYAAIAGNEITMIMWRRPRDAALFQIEKDRKDAVARRRLLRLQQASPNPPTAS